MQPPRGGRPGHSPSGEKAIKSATPQPEKQQESENTAFARVRQKAKPKTEAMSPGPDKAGSCFVPVVTRLPFNRRLNCHRKCNTKNTWALVNSFVD
jgi:hypothetical protein